MSEQPQNVEGDLPDQDSPDWLPDLPEGESDQAFYGEVPDEDA